MVLSRASGLVWRGSSTIKVNITKYDHHNMPELKIKSLHKKVLLKVMTSQKSVMCDLMKYLESPLNQKLNPAAICN